MENVKGFQDKRAEEREPLDAPVVCSVLMEDDEKFSAVLVDKSDAGIGIYTSYPLEEGSEIEICNPSLWSKCKIASVKWTRKVSNDLFRVGLSTY